MFKDPETNRQYHREYYKEHRTKRISASTASKKKKREWYRDYKATLSCAQCGAAHPAIIDFHHPDDNKENCVSTIVSYHNWSIKRILEEIAKCTPLCRNCHSILHWNENKEKRAER